MNRIMAALAAVVFAIAAAGVVSLAAGHDSGAASKAKSGDHHVGSGSMPSSLEEMRRMHRQHEHGHDFEAMESMSSAQRARVMALMDEIGVAMPPMDPKRRRQLFVAKGYIACHSVNGVGGSLGPALNAADMPRPMNAFEFAARMWRGAQAMTALQEELLG